MRYSKSAFERAEITLAERRERAEREHKERLAEIELQAPEIAVMNASLKNTNLELLKAITTSNKDTSAKDLITQIRDKNLMTQQTIKELLKTCGYPEDYLEITYSCPKCRDMGFCEGVRCECFDKLLAKYTTDELNENCLIRLHDFSEFRIDFYPDSGVVSPRKKMGEIYDYCKKYTDNFNKNSSSLFFFGQTGLGKTFLSSCIANNLLKEGFNVVFGSILHLFRTIESEHFGRSEGNTLDIIINADLVILDDLGSEFQTSFTDSVLYEIINDRLNLGKPIIISTNLSMKEMNSKYNERIISRLTGCFTPLMFMGEDIRHVKRKLGLE
ncbi:MAG: ATP-binding protein [Hominimerdicola sp.]